MNKLLDELHGSGKAPGTTSVAEVAATGSSSSDDISDDEFEKLLDELHGAGKFSPSNVAVEAAPAARSEPRVESVASDAGMESGMDEPSEAPAVQLSTPARAKKAAEVSHEEPDDDDAEEAYAPRRSAKADDSARSSSGGKAANPKVDSIATETTVRVDTKRLDDIMNMVGELVLVRNRLKRLGDESDNESLQKAVSNLDVVTGDLQSAVMQTRMQPIKKVFGRFPRVVRDLARNLKKEVNLVLVGEETDLDKNLVEALSDPLVHLVRNAVDHGIEMPDFR